VDRGLELFDIDELTSISDGFHEESQMPMDEIAEEVLHRLAARKGPEIAEALRQAVWRLPEPMRTVFSATFSEKLPHVELAQGLGTSVEAIDFLLEISLELLSQVIEVRIREI
jgi:DNA-directed RNA polymerase specialized sigma24 family protein